MRLLLRSGANPGMENNNGKSPLSIAKERGHALCEEMVRKNEVTSFMQIELINNFSFAYLAIILIIVFYILVVPCPPTKENNVRKC